MVTDGLILWAEAAALLLAIPVAFLAPGFGKRFFVAVEQAGSRLARRRTLSLIVVGLLPLLLRAFLLPVLGIPEPAVHEEFSYLLAGDTFASGRIANPPHPMWVHFESFQILHQPTYGSIRLPGQGLLLALGQVLSGHPWFGVYLSIGLMCGCLCWMLYGWLPPGWALLGGLFCGIRFGVFSFWMNSYWGGALAAAGGALVVGALPRIMRTAPRAGQSLLMGSGALLLAITRPYEGFLVCAGTAAVLVIHFWKSRPDFATITRTLLVPLALVMAIGFASLCYYDYRTTHNPFVTPYQLGVRQYLIAPFFLWQTPAPIPVYRHEVMRQYYVNWDFANFLEETGPGGLLMWYGMKSRMAWSFYVRPVFTLPLLLVWCIWRDRRVRPALAIFVVAILGVAVECWTPPYYLAPMTGLLIIIVLQALRHLRRWQAEGLFLSRAIPAIALGIFLCISAVEICRLPVFTNDVFACVLPRSRLMPRARVLAKMESWRGQHLAIVRYKPGHSVHLEWVYNQADIDGSKIVWARDMGAERNAELVRYFRGRRVWLVEPDEQEPRVTPYQ